MLCIPSRDAISDVLMENHLATRAGLEQPRMNEALTEADSELICRDSGWKDETLKTVNETMRRERECIHS